MKTLLVATWISGIVGKGKPMYKIVHSKLTPEQYKRKFYNSDYHFRTENAISVKKLK